MRTAQELAVAPQTVLKPTRARSTLPGPQPGQESLRTPLMQATVPQISRRVPQGMVVYWAGETAMMLMSLGL